MVKKEPGSGDAALNFGARFLSFLHCLVLKIIHNQKLMSNWSLLLERVCSAATYVPISLYEKVERLL